MVASKPEKAACTGLHIQFLTPHDLIQSCMYTCMHVCKHVYYFMHVIVIVVRAYFLLLKGLLPHIHVHDFKYNR